MRINVTHLRSFLAVARHGGFSRAANAIGVSQPTLTRQILDLEAGYKMRLFDRSTRKIRLTPDGETLLTLAQRVFDDLDVVDAFLRPIERAQMTVFSVRHEKVAAFLGMANAAASAPRINVFQMGSVNVYEGLMAQACCMGFLTMPEAVDAKEFDYFEIAREPVFAYVGKAHPWSERRAISLRELDGQAIVIGTRGAQTRRTFDKQARRLGIEVQIVQEIDNNDIIQMMALAGRGIGIVGGTGGAINDKGRALHFLEAEMMQPLHCAALPPAHRSAVDEAMFALAKGSLAYNAAK